MTSSSSTTRTLMRAIPRGTQRQRRPAPPRRRPPRVASSDLAAVAAHDVARDREAEARAARLLGRVEGLEDPLAAAGGQARRRGRRPRRGPSRRLRSSRQVTTPPSGEASRALVKRLTKTCSSSRGVADDDQAGSPSAIDLELELAAGEGGLDRLGGVGEHGPEVGLHAACAARGRANSRRLLTRCAARKVCRSIFFRIA